MNSTEGKEALKFSFKQTNNAAKKKLEKSLCRLYRPKRYASKKFKNVKTTINN